MKLSFTRHISSGTISVNRVNCSDTHVGNIHFYDNGKWDLHVSHWSNWIEGEELQEIVKYMSSKE